VYILKLKLYNQVLSTFYLQIKIKKFQNIYFYKFARITTLEFAGQI